MRRSIVFLTTAFVASVLVGCDGGIKEGTSTEPATPSGQPVGFQELMEKNAKDMKLKNARPKTPPAAPKQGS